MTTRATAQKRSSKPDDLFSQNYRLDESTDLYMIEVGLDQYASIFSTWDPAPFKRRDIDPDLKIYLEEAAEEIPSRYPIELCFVLPHGSRNVRMEAEAQQGLQNSFSFKLYLLRKELKQINTRIVRFIAIGFLLIALSLFLPGQLESAPLLATLIEGVAIAGWVFLWEAVSLFAFTNRDLAHRYRLYNRLKTAPVFFQEAAAL